MSFSLAFLYFALFFIAGIFVSSVFSIPQFLLLSFLVVGIGFISIFWKHKKLLVIGFCLLFLVAGIWRHQQAELEIVTSPLRNLNDQEERMILVGAIIQEPDVRSSSMKLTIQTRYIVVDTEKTALSGKVLVTVNRYPGYRYGDTVQVVGKLQTPFIFEDFNYQDYLAKEGIYSVMYWPNIELVQMEGELHLAQLAYGAILQAKEKLRASIYQNLSPPESSIIGAMILGDKSRMSDELKEKLNLAGVRHITAISGMHITILSVILIQLFIAIGLWRHQSFYLTLIFLALFIVMVGLPASAVRAGIFTGLFLWAQKEGRLKSASRAITFAAAFMLAVNPLLLLSDVGFQLSFLAVIGIIYLGPIFQGWLRRIPEDSFLRLRSILSMTLAAQVFTAPILLYNFGSISLMAPITNVLILPLLPYIFGAGFLFGILGIFWNTLGWIFSWPAWLLLRYITTIVDFLSQLPFAAVAFEIHWVWLVISYVVLGSITWWLNQRERFKILKV